MPQGQFLLETVELFDTPQAWRMLASFYRTLGQPEKAREALEAAVDKGDLAKGRRADCELAMTRFL